MKRLAFYTAVILGTLLVLFILWQLRLIFLLLLLSVIVAAAVRPLVRRLQKAGLPLPVAQGIVYLGGLGVTAVIIYAISRPLVREIDIFTNYLIITYRRVFDSWAAGSASQQLLQARLPSPDQFSTYLSQDLFLLQRLLGLTQGLATALGGFLLTLVLSLYWSLDQNRFERLWLSLLPVQHRIHVRRLWRKLETAVSRYLRLEIGVSLIIGLILWLGFTLLQLDYPLLLALLGALTWFIPLINVLLLAPPVYWIAAIESPAVTVAALAFIVMVFGSLEYLVEPRLLRHRRYSPLLILLVTVPLVEITGFIGVAFAPPIAVAIQILLDQVTKPRALASDTGATLAHLAKRQEDLSRRLNGREKTDNTDTANLLARLGNLIRDTEKAMQAPSADNQ